MTFASFFFYKYYYPLFSVPRNDDHEQKKKMIAVRSLLLWFYSLALSTLTVPSVLSFTFTGPSTRIKFRKHRVYSSDNAAICLWAMKNDSSSNPDESLQPRNLSFRTSRRLPVPSAPPQPQHRSRHVLAPPPPSAGRGSGQRANNDGGRWWSDAPL